MKVGEVWQEKKRPWMYIHILKYGGNDDWYGTYMVNVSEALELDDELGKTEKKGLENLKKLGYGFVYNSLVHNKPMSGQKIMEDFRKTDIDGSFKLFTIHGFHKFNYQKMTEIEK